jgi:hypothetical protein
MDPLHDGPTCRSDFFGFSLYPRTPVELEPGHLDEGALEMQRLMQARPWPKDAAAKLPASTYC